MMIVLINVSICVVNMLIVVRLLRTSEECDLLVNVQYSVIILLMCRMLVLWIPNLFIQSKGLMCWHVCKHPSALILARIKLIIFLHVVVSAHVSPLSQSL